MTRSQVNWLSAVEPLSLSACFARLDICREELLGVRLPNRTLDQSADELAAVGLRISRYLRGEP